MYVLSDENQNPIELVFAKHCFLIVPVDCYRYFLSVTQEHDRSPTVTILYQILYIFVQFYILAGT